MRDHDGIDGREQVRVDMANVIADRAVMQRHGVHPGFRHPHDLADEEIVSGDVFDPVIIAIQAEPDHAQHQNVPKIHSWPARMRALVADHFFIQQIENRVIDLWRAEDPLEASQHWGQFITTFERNHHLRDGRLPRSVWHSNLWRMLTDQTRMFSFHERKIERFNEYSTTGATSPENIRQTKGRCLPDAALIQ